MKIINLPIEFPIDSAKKVIIDWEHGDIVIRYRNSPKEGYHTGHGAYCKNLYEVLNEARWFAIKYKVLELDMWITKIRSSKERYTIK